MKNEYSFKTLARRSLPSREDEINIFLKMSKVIETGVLKTSFCSLSELFDNLPPDEYYIAHNLTTKKGKKKTFTGRVFISKRNDLLSFLNDSSSAGDMRCFLLSPVSSNASEFIIYIDSEQIHLYQAKN